MERHSNHVIIIYALIALLAAWLFYDLITRDDGSSWMCSNVVCSQVTGPQEWMQQNCFEAATTDNVQMVCRIQIDGISRLVPLSELNLTGIAVCAQYACVQEVKVRAVNYTVNSTGIV